MTRAILGYCTSEYCKIEFLKSGPCSGPFPRPFPYFFVFFVTLFSHALKAKRMVHAVGAIQGKCVDKHRPSHVHVHEELQVIVIKSQMTLTDDAVFFFFKG